jgi:hypothetical protein
MRGEDSLTSDSPARTRVFRVYAVRPSTERVPLVLEGRITRSLTTGSTAIDQPPDNSVDAVSDGVAAGDASALDLATFVDVTLDSELLREATRQSVATQFHIAVTGQLQPACVAPAEGCVFAVEIAFSRRDGGSRPIPVDVAWVLSVDGYTQIPAEADGGSDGAWRIEEIGVGARAATPIQDGGAQ